GARRRGILGFASGVLYLPSVASLYAPERWRRAMCGIAPRADAFPRRFCGAGQLQAHVIWRGGGNETSSGVCIAYGERRDPGLLQVRSLLTFAYLRLSGAGGPLPPTMDTLHRAATARPRSD